ncbi:hypothetical protein HNP49_000678 [Pseudomonas fluvialis]|uniref:TniQ domain-containing protein n=1 Tax=Pseudomonas fluvialis TaxID=1793966 RepID=A0A7X0BQ51_9PSED|nr:hypothetical protein [Pseudomonas fluvialis]
MPGSTGPHPFEGELFSSWLCRLAWGNGTKLLPFVTHHLLLPPQFLNQDIDRVVSDSVIIGVGAGCGVADATARATKLSVFEGILWERLAKKGSCDWVLTHIRGARNPRQRAGHSLQFCRRCLAEDTEPHFRCTWRLALSVICPIHGIYLADECPRCHSPVVPTICDRGQRLLQLSTPLASCYRCGTDLREPLIDDLFADAESRIFQEMVLDALGQGRSAHLPGGNCYSFLLFRGLKRLLQLLGGEGRFKRVRELMFLEEGLLDLPLQAGAHFCLETLRIGDRALMLALLRLLLEDWPSVMIDVCRRSRVSSSYLLSYKGDLPYWLYQPIRDQLFDKPYSPTPLERHEARQYLIRNGEPAHASAVRQLLGMWTASDSWKLEHPPWNRRRPL